MATPMFVFAEIAARYGVDRYDQDAVDEFFEYGIHDLTGMEQDAIAQELLERDGEEQPS